MVEMMFIKTARCTFDKYLISMINKNNEGPSNMKIIYDLASLILSNLFLHTRAFFSLLSHQFLQKFYI
jgi:hypothetical protein